MGYVYVEKNVKFECLEWSSGFVILSLKKKKQEHLRMLKIRPSPSLRRNKILRSFYDYNAKFCKYNCQHERTSKSILYDLDVPNQRSALWTTLYLTRLVLIYI